MDHSPTMGHSPFKPICEPARLLPHLYHFSLKRKYKQMVAKAIMYNCTGCLQRHPVKQMNWNQAMYPGAGLFISQKKGYFFLINTEVGRWTNENLSHSLQKAWIRLILKTSYLGFPGGLFPITSFSTASLHGSLDTIPRISVPCCGVLLLCASRKIQSSLVVSQCRGNCCLISEVGR